MESTGKTMPRIVVGVTGATGAPIAVRVLQFLKELNVEVHLVVSKWAIQTLHTECGLRLSEIADYATEVHDVRDQGASISSGSFRHDGMLIVPCSMKTLAAIRTGYRHECSWLTRSEPEMARCSS